MPVFFVFAVAFTVFMLEGKRAIFFSVAELVVYIVICAVAYKYPETVYKFTSEEELMTDIVVAFATVCVVLGVCMFIHFRLYNEQQRKLDEQNHILEDANHMKIEFLGNVSHELKTPLTSVSGFARYSFRVMESETLSDEDLTEMRDNLRRIVVESDRMKDVVEQLLDVAAIEQGKFSLRKQRVSIVGLAEEVKSLHFKTLNENRNTFNIDIPDELPDIEADHDRLFQVLLNLLSNALRHTEDGVVTLSAIEGSEYITICMSDNGEGILKETQQTIFERYLGADVGRAHGTGIGLYICKQIVEAHGGEIQIESNPGEGTAVLFTLPLNEDVTDG